MRKLLPSIVAAIALPLASQAAIFAANDVVDAVDAAPGDGQCLTSTGTCSLRAAFMEANALPGRDTLQVGPGTHLLTLAGALELSEQADIAGAGPGVSIVDANGLGSAIDGQFAVTAPKEFTLTGVTVRGASGASGAVHVIGEGSYRFSNVEIVSNQGAFGVHLELAGTVRIENSMIADNLGAGVATFHTENLEIVDSDVSDNGGHGIHWIFWPAPATLTLRGCDLDRNGATGVRFEGYGTVRIENTRVRFSAATGLWIATPSDVEITRSLVERNRGGGLYKVFDQGPGLRIRESAFVANSNGSGAGGIELVYASLSGSTVIANSTISGNQGQTAGGLLVSGACADVRIQRSTVVANRSLSTGGGFSVSGGSSCLGGSSPTDLEGSIVAANSATTAAPDCAVVGAVPGLQSFGGNVVGNDSGCAFTPLGSDQVGTSGTPLDPLLAPLAMLTGLTPVHVSLAGSPALDSSTCPDLFDQRGFPRPVDGDGDAIALCDAGSFEAGDFDADGLLDPTDNCVAHANPTQADAEGDLVGDVCDGCTTIANPRVPVGYLSANPWATLTGGQRDDDLDGYGNRCDAKFPGTAGTIVGAADVAQFRASAGKSVLLDVCGTSGARPCAIFDLNEISATIGAPDLAILRQRLGKAPGPKCPSCPLSCSTGPDGDCSP